jgi:hypothetical protein
VLEAARFDANRKLFSLVFLHRQRRISRALFLCSHEARCRTSQPPVREGRNPAHQQSQRRRLGVRCSAIPWWQPRSSIASFTTAT